MMMTMTTKSRLCLRLCFCVSTLIVTGWGFLNVIPSSTFHKSYPVVRQDHLHLGNNNNDASSYLSVITKTSKTKTKTSLYMAEFDSSKGKYKFGDITRGLINRATGKDKYEFGDLTKHVIKNVSNITGKEKYEFGDITKAIVANYTGKDVGEYQFGDISKSIIKRIRSGEYQFDDVILALQVLLSTGVRILPIAHFFPVKILMDLIGFGLTQKVSVRVLESLAVALDERMKEALVGDPKYQLGDLTKKKIINGIGKFTGKDNYEFGDISRAVSKLSSSTSSSSSSSSQKSKKDSSNNDDVDYESKLMEIFANNDKEAAAELEEWDRMFQKRQNDKGTRDNKV